MSKLGKILGPVLVVLTIGAAVLSFLIAQNRTMFRERAAKLSKGVADIASTLDSGSGASSSVTFTAGEKESGTLGWPEYKADANKYGQTIGKAQTLAGQVVEQRNAEGQALLEISQLLWYPSALLGEQAAEDINSLEKYEELIAKLKKHAEDTRKRDIEVAAGLAQIASRLGVNIGITPSSATKLLEQPFNAENGELKPYQMKAAVDALAKAVENLQARCNKYSDGYNNFIGAVNKHQWKATKLRPNADLSTVNAQINVLIRDDASSINKDLAAKTQLEAQVKTLEAQKAQMQEELAKLKADLAAQDRKIKELTGDDEGEVAASRVPLTSIKEMRNDVNGQVLAVNEVANCAVISLNNCEVVVGAVMAVSNGKEFITTVKVSSTNGMNSVVVPVELDGIKLLNEGQLVILGSSKLQDPDVE